MGAQPVEPGTRGPVINICGMNGFRKLALSKHTSQIPSQLICAGERPNPVLLLFQTASDAVFSYKEDRDTLWTQDLSSLVFEK